MAILLVGALAILLLVVIVVGYFIAIYNGLVTLKNNIEKAWSNIDVLLKQRHDELPKLIKVCESYMQYERETFERITKARTFYNNANTVEDKAQANNMVSSALKTLFAVAENYPQLKANENFMQLQGRITGLEENIADRREFYNESVNNYNIRIAQIPDLIVARMLGYPPKPMFQVAEEDKKDIDINIKVPS
jgi:LemA protein